jgi:hypothetical protein
MPIDAACSTLGIKVVKRVEFVEPGLAPVRSVPAVGPFKPAQDIEKLKVRGPVIAAARPAGHSKWPDRLRCCGAGDWSMRGRCNRNHKRS